MENFIRTLPMVSGVILDVWSQQCERRNVKGPEGNRALRRQDLIFHCLYHLWSSPLLHGQGTQLEAWALTVRNSFPGK